MSVANHLFALLFSCCLVGVSSCRVRSAEADAAELTPAQRQRLGAGVNAMVQGSVMNDPQTFTIRVADPQGRPIAGVPAIALVTRADGNPMGMLVQRRSFMSDQAYHPTSDATGTISLTVERYMLAQLALDLSSIGSRWIVPWNSSDPRFPISDAAEDRTWIAKGQSHKLRRSATLAILPTTQPEPLLKMRWVPGVRQVDAWRTVTLTVGDYGRIFGGGVTGHASFDPAAAPLDIVVRGWRAEGKRRARPWMSRRDQSTGEQLAPESQAEPSPWWLELTGARGVGFIDASADPWAYHAPEAGWRLRLRFGSADGSATSIPVRFWIRRPGTPVRYALFDGEARLVRPGIPNPEFVPDPQPGTRLYPERDEIGLFGTLWINPSGSRNLERPGTWDQERFWKPAPDPCTNLNRHEPMVAAWSAEAPEGRIPLLDDLPPAPDGVPAPQP